MQLVSPFSHSTKYSFGYRMWRQTVRPAEYGAFGSRARVPRTTVRNCRVLWSESSKIAHPDASRERSGATQLPAPSRVANSE
jgi:hypothetical protein